MTSMLRLTLALLPAVALAALLSPRAPMAPCTLARCRSAHMSSDFGELERRLREQVRELTTTRFGPARALLKRDDTAYVLLFNRNTPSEGVYTLQGNLDAPGTYMVAFEDSDGA